MSSSYWEDALKGHKISRRKALAMAGAGASAAAILAACGSSGSTGTPTPLPSSDFLPYVPGQVILWFTATNAPTDDKSPIDSRVTDDLRRRVPSLADDNGKLFGSGLLNAPTNNKIPMPAGTQILQVVNLESWREDLDPHGHGEGVKSAIDDVVKVVDLVNNLKPPFSSNGYTLKGALPNYFVVPSQDWGFGSPGGPAQPARAAASLHQGVAAALQTPLGGTAYNGNDGKGIKVAVLDTWPVEATALNTDWSKKINDADMAATANGKPNSKLSMWGKKPSPTWKDLIGRETGKRWPQPLYYDARYVAYLTDDIPDHGLFVASVIEDISPNVDFSVFRMMCDRGVCPLSIALQALIAALAWAGTDRTIINGSWVVGYDPGQPALPLLEEFFGDFSSQAKSTHENVLFVFSAGNTSAPKSKPDPPLLPAANNASNQLCVYAWNANANFRDKCDFSNFVQGQPNGIAARGEGIVGPYTVDPFAWHEAPQPGSKPTTGLSAQDPEHWVTWKGTSMAAAVVTGAVAAIWSQRGQIPASQLATEILTNAPKTPGRLTAPYIGI